MSDEAEALERFAVKDGAAYPVTIRHGSHPGARGLPRYTIEISGPFGDVRAEDDDLFGALQLARRRFEPQGWLLAVEGSRAHSHPSGMQRDQAGGRVAYRLDEAEGDGPYPVRSILDPVDVSECATVVDQERWYQERHTRRPLRPQLVGGRGWRMLIPDLGGGRVVYQAMADGAPVVARDSAGRDIAVLYTDAIEALAAGLEPPRRIRAERMRTEFPAGVVVDRGKPWESRTIPVAPHKLPRLHLGGETADPRLTAILPGARVLPSRDDGAALLVIVPVGSDLDAGAVSLGEAVGAALIPPIILVVAGAEPGQVRRALKGRS